MSKQSETLDFSDQEFDAIQTAVMETDRGRHFLTEYSRRNRVADTQTLLDAMRRLENNIAPRSPEDRESDEDLASLAQAISATSQDICSVRNDMLSDDNALANDQAVFSNLSHDASQIAAELITTAEVLQSTVVGMRDTDGETPHVATIDANVSTLFESGWRQDVLAQRIAKAMDLLTHLQTNLTAFAPVVEVRDAPSEPRQTELSDDNRKFFAEDEELFDAAKASLTAQDEHRDDEPEVEEFIAQGEPSSDEAPTEITPVDETSKEAAVSQPSGESRVVVVRAPPETSVEPEFEDAPVTAEPELETASPAEVEGNGNNETADDPGGVMESFGEIASTTPVPKLPVAEAPQPEMELSKADKERIVIIRKSSSDETEIPFADYLGLEAQQPQNKAVAD